MFNKENNYFPKKEIKEKKYTDQDMLDFARVQIFKSLLYGEKAINEEELVKSLLNFNKGIK